MAAEGIDDLPLVGGHIALDLINTVEPRVPNEQGREHLTSPAALLAWAGRASLLDEGELRQVAAAWQQNPAAGPKDLKASIELRESLYQSLTAMLESRTPDLALITARWAAAASRASLGMTPEGARMQAAPSIPDRLAFAAVDLLTGLDLTRLQTRLRACPVNEGGCGWLFLDNSRNNSRRWCVMADCGTQAKSRKLTERRRSARIAGRVGTPN
ncbi:MAG TPA: ABATE domain-containing protein [Acidothermaceae bacterium]|nr:ABATE domain-containing protein [Acidothermaceae bacterium]